MKKPLSVSVIYDGDLMKEIILIKNGELSLKGLNRREFENVLVGNIKRRLKDIMDCRVSKSQSTIMVEPVDENADMDEAAEAVSRIFGIAGYSRAAQVEKDMDVIKASAIEYLREDLESVATFKVEARRSDKSFPLKSPEISREVGAHILRNFPHIKVDVHNPEITVYVEVRDRYAFIHGDQIKGAGGMPVGTAGKAAILISGGLDSPVAAYMMAKRGLVLTGIHFASPPYTSQRAEEKVHMLMKEVSEWSGRMDLYVVPFTEIQEQIREKCPEEMFTIIMRRMMVLVAEKVALENDCKALITGESLGQVASQTLEALACTDAVAGMPVFRPLIGMDKEEIVDISRKIGTYETSIQPYEDCCTVFTPRHPKLKPRKHMIEEAEKALDMEELVKRAAEGVRLVKIEP